MYESILHKPLRLRTNISASARNVLEGVSEVDINLPNVGSFNRIC